MIRIPYSHEYADIAAKHLAIRTWEQETGQYQFSSLTLSQKDLMNIPYHYPYPGGFWIKVIDNDIVGFVGLTSEGEGKRFCVMQGHHGKGYGDELCQHLITQGELNGLDRIYGSTGRKEHAINVYLRNGFQIYGEDDDTDEFLVEIKFF